MKSIDLGYSDAVAKHINRAINYRKEEGLIRAWLMARASYAYSRSNGLSIHEALAGAIELFRESL